MGGGKEKGNEMNITSSFRNFFFAGQPNNGPQSNSLFVFFFFLRVIDFLSLGPHRDKKNIPLKSRNTPFTIPNGSHTHTRLQPPPLTPPHPPSPHMRLLSLRQITPPPSSHTPPLAVFLRSLCSLPLHFSLALEKGRALKGRIGGRADNGPSSGGRGGEKWGWCVGERERKTATRSGRTCGAGQGRCGVGWGPCGWGVCEREVGVSGGATRRKGGGGNRGGGERNR